MSWVKISDEDGGTYGEKWKTAYAQTVTINSLNSQIVDCTTKINTCNDAIAILNAATSNQNALIVQVLNEKIETQVVEITQLEFQITKIQELIDEITNG